MIEKKGVNRKVKDAKLSQFKLVLDSYSAKIITKYGESNCKLNPYLKKIIEYINTNTLPPFLLPLFENQTTVEVVKNGIVDKTKLKVPADFMQCDLHSCVDLRPTIDVFEENKLKDYNEKKYDFVKFKGKKKALSKLFGNIFASRRCCSSWNGDGRNLYRFMQFSKECSTVYVYAYSVENGIEIYIRLNYKYINENCVAEEIYDYNSFNSDSDVENDLSASNSKTKEHVLGDNVNNIKEENESEKKDCIKERIQSGEEIINMDNKNEEKEIFTLKDKFSLHEKKEEKEEIVTKTEANSIEEIKESDKEECKVISDIKQPANAIHNNMKDECVRVDIEQIKNEHSPDLGSEENMTKKLKNNLKNNSHEEIISTKNNISNDNDNSVNSIVKSNNTSGNSNIDVNDTTDNSNISINDNTINNNNNIVSNLKSILINSSISNNSEKKDSNLDKGQNIAKSDKSKVTLLIDSKSMETLNKNTSSSSLNRSNSTNNLDNNTSGMNNPISIISGLNSIQFKSFNTDNDQIHKIFVSSSDSADLIFDEIKKNLNLLSYEKIKETTSGVVRLRINKCGKKNTSFSSNGQLDIPESAKRVKSGTLERTNIGTKTVSKCVGKVGAKKGNIVSAENGLASAHLRKSTSTKKISPDTYNQILKSPNFNIDQAMVDKNLTGSSIVNNSYTGMMNNLPNTNLTNNNLNMYMQMGNVNNNMNNISNMYNNSINNINNLNTNNMYNINNISSDCNNNINNMNNVNSMCRISPVPNYTSNIVNKNDFPHVDISLKLNSKQSNSVYEKNISTFDNTNINTDLNISQINSKNQQENISMKSGKNYPTKSKIKSLDLINKNSEETNINIGTNIQQKKILNHIETVDINKAKSIDSINHNLVHTTGNFRFLKHRSNHSMENPTQNNLSNTKTQIKDQLDIEVNKNQIMQFPQKCINNNIQSVEVHNKGMQNIYQPLNTIKRDNINQFSAEIDSNLINNKLNRDQNMGNLINEKSSYLNSQINTQLVNSIKSNITNKISDNTSIDQQHRNVSSNDAIISDNSKINEDINIHNMQSQKYAHTNKSNISINNINNTNNPSSINNKNLSLTAKNQINNPYTTSIANANAINAFQSSFQTIIPQKNHAYQNYANKNVSPENFPVNSLDVQKSNISGIQNNTVNQIGLNNQTSNIQINSTIENNKLSDKILDKQITDSCDDNFRNENQVLIQNEIIVLPVLTQYLEQIKSLLKQIGYNNNTTMFIISPLIRIDSLLNDANVDSATINSIYFILSQCLDTFIKHSKPEELNPDIILAFLFQQIKSILRQGGAKDQIIQSIMNNLINVIRIFLENNGNTVETIKNTLKGIVEMINTKSASDLKAHYSKNITNRSMFIYSTDKSINTRKATSDNQKLVQKNLSSISSSAILQDSINKSQNFSILQCEATNQNYNIKNNIMSTPNNLNPARNIPNTLNTDFNIQNNINKGINVQNNINSALKNPFLAENNLQRDIERKNIHSRQGKNNIFCDSNQTDDNLCTFNDDRIISRKQGNMLNNSNSSMHEINRSNEVIQNDNLTNNTVNKVNPNNIQDFLNRSSSYNNIRTKNNQNLNDYNLIKTPSNTNINTNNYNQSPDLRATNNRSNVSQELRNSRAYNENNTQTQQSQVGKINQSHNSSKLDININNINNYNYLNQRNMNTDLHANSASSPNNLNMRFDHQSQIKDMNILNNTAINLQENKHKHNNSYDNKETFNSKQLNISQKYTNNQNISLKNAYNANNQQKNYNQDNLMPPNVIHTTNNQNNQCNNSQQSNTHSNQSTEIHRFQNFNHKQGYTPVENIGDNQNSLLKNFNGINSLQNKNINANSLNNINVHKSNNNHNINVNIQSTNNQITVNNRANKDFNQIQVVENSLNIPNTMNLQSLPSNHYTNMQRVQSSNTKEQLNRTNLKTINNNITQNKRSINDNSFSNSFSDSNTYNQFATNHHSMSFHSNPNRTNQQQNIECNNKSILNELKNQQDVNTNSFQLQNVSNYYANNIQNQTQINQSTPYQHNSNIFRGNNNINGVNMGFPNAHSNLDHKYTIKDKIQQKIFNANIDHHTNNNRSNTPLRNYHTSPSLNKNQTDSTHSKSNLDQNYNQSNSMNQNLNQTTIVNRNQNKMNLTNVSLNQNIFLNQNQNQANSKQPIHNLNQNYKQHITNQVFNQNTTQEESLNQNIFANPNFHLQSHTNNQVVNKINPNEFSSIDNATKMQSTLKPSYKGSIIDNKSIGNNFNNIHKNPDINNSNINLYSASNNVYSNLNPNFNNQNSQSNYPNQSMNENTQNNMSKNVYQPQNLYENATINSNFAQNSYNTFENNIHHNNLKQKINAINSIPQRNYPQIIHHTHQNNTTSMTNPSYNIYNHNINNPNMHNYSNKIEKNFNVLNKPIYNYTDMMHNNPQYNPYLMQYNPNQMPMINQNQDSTKKLHSHLSQNTLNHREINASKISHFQNISHSSQNSQDTQNNSQNINSQDSKKKDQSNDDEPCDMPDIF
ncbi:hypothetical protein EDEG_03663 [Edhazardia aedis USNM 41457]|uniref:Uncharacterized protein n=1 Tax=Edhazardia aedis (strain USNM 41457) TaxID=1003232 RepID=J9D2Q5_EDHAE|nr:hypothetical protein EDEG_03663 [Edhazardia aedis USNM 41457]|eukprot:EJW01864.1 hypothetical protein EDEG_03663 [Edhazardia aedis USNM 41457]